MFSEMSARNPCHPRQQQGTQIVALERLKRFGLLFSVLLNFFAIGASPALAQTIRLEGDIWPPYVMDPASGKKGYMVDVAEAAFARAGYKILFAAVPWSRALVETESASSDGIVGIYFNQAKAKGFVVPSEEIGISTNHLFVENESTWAYSGINSLNSMTLGVIANYDYGELNDYIERLKSTNSNALQITSGNDALEKNLRKLITGRISVLVEDFVVTNFVARQIGIENRIKSAGMVKPRNQVGIAFSPANPKSVKYANVLSEEIRNMRKSGELKTILDQYGVLDWK